MQELYPIIQKWQGEGKAFALATILKTWGSAPRPVGSHMLISEDMEMAGSVSGGCVEAAVVRQAQEILTEGKAREFHFGVSNEEAWEVGLSCGGRLDLWIEPWGDSSSWEALSLQLNEGNPCMWVEKIDAQAPSHTLITPKKELIGAGLPEALIEGAFAAYLQRRHGLLEWEGKKWFVRVLPPKSRLLIIGAAHISVDLVILARIYGFESIVIDPRSLFTQQTQFEVMPDQMHAAYPSEVLEEMELDAYTYAVVLSHDPKIDDNALPYLLGSEVAYIGALGGRKNQTRRQQRLREAGYSEEEIGRIHGPIGLDIHAKGAKEIALAIMAEIISVKNKYV